MRNKNLIISLLFFMLLLIFSIAWAQTKKNEKKFEIFDAKEINFLNKIGQNKNKASKKGSQKKDFLIGTEDVVDVLVWKNEDLSKEVFVRPDGVITLPLIDDIQAAGKTTLELKEVITKKLKKYIDDPHVTVSLRHINSSKIFLLGEIVNPGILPLRSKTTLLQAIAMAGGFREFADLKGIFVLRSNGERVNVNYKAILKGDSSQNISLKKGDIIVVP